MGQFQSPADLRRVIREAGRIPAQRDTRYRVLRQFAAHSEAGEDTALDRVTDSEAVFGSYTQLTRDERFRFKLPIQQGES